MRPVLFLIAYHLFFYRDFYFSPFKMCTSEIASSFFPHWIWMGHELRAGIFPFKDDIYYIYPGCLPVLSTFYPWTLLSAWLGAFLPLDSAFILYAHGILLHYLLGGIFAYLYLLKSGTFVALFGAISLVYSAYFVKPFTPCAAYTHCWAIGCLLGGKFGAFSLGMALLSGYYPTFVYLFPFLIILKPEISWGILIGLIQLIPFLWYWPKSIRSKAKWDKNFGRVPLWRHLDFILPNRVKNTINGILWPEMALFCGIVPLIVIMAKFNFWMIPMALSFFLKIQRGSCRSLYLLIFSLVMIAVNQPIGIGLLFLQAFLLLLNRNLYPHFPFCQWWQKPSMMFKRGPLIRKWPYFTGYIQGKMIEPYWGGFCLKENAKEDSYVGFR